MTYSHFQHRHNFALWCAARAVQRGFAKTSILKLALEKSGVVEIIKNIEENSLSQQDFDKLHESWCDSILGTWEKSTVKGASYGRAAKLLAVYIKSMVVVQNVANNLSDVAHPPIDRIILQNISKDKNINHPHKAAWKEINWTQLNKSEYKRLVADFRQVFYREPFWAIEKYWIVQDVEGHNHWGHRALPQLRKNENPNEDNGNGWNGMLVTNGGYKAKRFDWVFQNDNVKIRNEDGRQEEYPLDEIYNVMKWLEKNFEHSWFPLANNVAKLGQDTEVDGLGVAILRQRPNDISHAQGASYLGVFLEHVGILKWNNKQKGIKWRIIRLVRNTDDLRSAINARDINEFQ